MKAIKALFSLSVALLPAVLSNTGCYHHRREVIVEERRERPREVIVERPARREVIVERPERREVIIEHR